MPNLFRNLPSVNQLLEHPQLQKMIETANHSVVVEGVRTFLDDVREQIKSASDEVHVPTANELAEKIASWLKSAETSNLRPVINGTGIILHTGLGRAPLAKSALHAICDISENYASVELDLKTGQRGQRMQAVQRLLQQLTGAESALVVNNNAAATVLTLSTLSANREVIVSRGELIEIGGSYRLPDVMRCSGAILREVGTTNKTHPSDYEAAIQENTGAILKVHPSNFQIVGFANSVTTKKLVDISAQQRLPVIDDIGSGALIDFSRYGLTDEPTATASIQAGADVVLFSGDKLLGGPQCGIIIGKRSFIDQIQKNPLMRAMRVDKLTLAGLAATLQLYRNPEQAELELPILRMLSMPVENLRLRAEKIAKQIEHLPVIGSCSVEQTESMLGGGSLPSQVIPSYCLSIKPTDGSVDQFSAKLRMGSIPVIGRVSHDRLLLDMRTVAPGQDVDLVAQFEQICKS